MKGYSEKNGIRVGFGEVRGKVLAALSCDVDKLYRKEDTKKKISEQQF